MKIESLSPSRIRGRLSGYLLLVIAAGFMYWIFIGAGLVLLFERWLDLSTARLAAVISASFLVVGGMIAYVTFVTRQLSHCFLAVDDSTLTVKAQRSWSFTEVRFPLNQVKAVVLGETLNGLEQFYDGLHRKGVPKTSMELVKDLKTGRLSVHGPKGECTVFHFIDKSFDENDLAAFFAELQQRGVPVNTAR